MVIHGLIHGHSNGYHHGILTEVGIVIPSMVKYTPQKCVELHPNVCNQKMVHLKFNVAQSWIKIWAWHKKSYPEIDPVLSIENTVRCNQKYPENHSW